MEKEKLYEYAESIRRDLHTLVDRQVDDFLQRIESGESIEQADLLLPLTLPASSFKGTKPASVCLPGGEQVPCKTWREAATIILRDCDQGMHDRLLALSGKVAGRSRVILGDTAVGMRRPIKICDGIYFESYFDTEYLLKMMTENVLKQVGYDYRSIQVQIRQQGEALSPVATPPLEKPTDLPEAENGEDETQGFTLSM